MPKNVAKRMPVPPKAWWNRFDPVYLGVIRTVFAVGLSRQTSVAYLGLSAVAVWSMLAYAFVLRKLHRGSSDERDVSDSWP